MKRPSQCRLWLKTNLSTRDLDLSKNFRILQTFVEESHFIRHLLRCKGCAQLYFYEFYEEIDWEEGNDPQYRTFIPVASEAEARQLAKLQPIELLQFSPRLHSAWPAHARAPEVKWIGR